MDDDEYISVLDIASMKEGKIFELADTEKDKKRAVRAAESIRQLILENKDIETEELAKKMKKQMKIFDLDEEDLRDALNNRKWVRIKKIKKSKDKVVIEIQKIRREDYHKIMDSLAEQIAKQLTTEDIQKLVKDAIADAGLEPEKLKELNEKGAVGKVETKRGCFNIIFDKDTVIPVR